MAAEVDERRRPGRPPDLPTVDHVSQIVHETWCTHMLNLGITSRPAADADAHEQIVPWEVLPEHGRELNRSLVQVVYQAIFVAWRAENQG